MSERMFPIMDGPAIPWSFIEPHEAQCLKNHYQTLQRLSERGGLSVCEALAVIESKGWNGRDNPETDSEKARKKLKEMLDSDARLELTRLRAENERLETELRTTHAQWQMTGSAKQVLEAENEELRKALEPMARLAQLFSAVTPDTACVSAYQAGICITLGDCRRAAELLKKPHELITNASNF